MALPRVTLYTAPGTSSLIPSILLHHAKIPFKPIEMAIASLGPNFVSTNPKGQVPVLLIDDEKITEVPAIVHAINHLAPDAEILGRDWLQTVRVCEWMNFLSASIHAQAWGPFIRPFRFTDEPDAEAGVKRKSMQNLRDRYALIEAKLSGEGWAVGNAFTAADVYLLSVSRWATLRANVDVEGDYPKWAGLVKRVQEIDGVREALAEEERIARELAG